MCVLSHELNSFLNTVHDLKGLKNHYTKRMTVLANQTKCFCGLCYKNKNFAATKDMAFHLEAVLFPVAHIFIKKTNITEDSSSGNSKEVCYIPHFHQSLISNSFISKLLLQSAS